MLTEFYLNVADEEDSFIWGESFDVSGHDLIVENTNK